MKTNFNKIKGSIFGQIIADSVGVPFEMKSRYYMKENPCIEMTDGGSHGKPKGYWSDDGSLTLALVESLLNNRELNIKDIADRKLDWFENGNYTPGGYSFGSGKTTREALAKYKKTGDPYTCGLNDINSNGNGSLMSIISLAFYLNKFEPNIDYRYKIVKKVSGITHAHPTSILACLYLLQFAQTILDGFNKFEAYNECRINFIADLNNTCDLDLVDENNFMMDLRYVEPFGRLLYSNIYELPEENINSGFYVVETLEAAIWCIMTTDDFKSAVLKAVNLGGDSDTTAALVGGLAGLIYGYDAIPRQWIHVLPRKEYLYPTISKFAQHFEMEENIWD